MASPQVIWFSHRKCEHVKRRLGGVFRRVFDRCHRSVHDFARGLEFDSDNGDVKAGDFNSDQSTVNTESLALSFC